MKVLFLFHVNVLGHISFYSCPHCPFVKCSQTHTQMYTELSVHFCFDWLNFFCHLFFPQCVLTIQSIIVWTLPKNSVVLVLNMKCGFYWSPCWWCFKRSQRLWRDVSHLIPLFLSIHCASISWSVFLDIGVIGELQGSHLDIFIPLFLSTDWTYTFCSLFQKNSLIQFPDMLLNAS